MLGWPDNCLIEQRVIILFGTLKTVSDIEPDAPRMLEELVRRAETAHASDIHLQMVGKSAQVSLRLDGLMTPPTELPETAADRVFGRIKYLARLKTYQESLPQDGRIDKGDIGSRNDIRVATYPTVTGEKIVLRMFAQSRALGLEELALSNDVCLELDRFLNRSSGMLLLTGPAGSGKTSTIYGCLQRLRKTGGRHIITVEDPVEQVIPGIMQTEVNETAGLDYATAAKHLLRQDPQVLVLGEIRDDETANLAVRAGLTGHLVISTLHAGSCKSVFERLLVMCRDHYAVWSAVELVLNQRLVRRICAACEGRGCSECLQTGFKGRVPAVEFVRLDDQVRAKARESGVSVITPTHSLQQAATDLRDRGVTNDAELGRILCP
ncbi:MAG: Type secretion system protein [Verrucomicrobiales bacterium]|nr:Type secretion system protein [Verrucomicrobiales bacterium]